ncbi:CoA transferase [Rhodococcus sp. BP-364]|uniref:CaiB/BaiF CoA-transferase family protein n=1 Tax=unclassified Rhodococcus (in: high G+C Gram-positive bacteria) TaxID=192944 RepID=UPI001C9A83A6|nr:MULTISPECIES: CoA transferase [unclassified Rhodococcus (in: high G+C Gram-positive bacteria)]MBY6615462.1 CoA transferase [Rhodococcus sp. BP-352]MBY6688078.1 CoA transferase [Rhodococcus sp. BP-331]MBY6575798.1 CoA transferase [Rhodococcus sp. BP-364]MBY6585099.1 CoA transferase [Rhodococcus sp. BP-358]MBY6589436.1 CoA transferase [Rhodococcus sp. BP-362]
MLDLTDRLGFTAARIFVGLGADVVRVPRSGEPDSAVDAAHWHAGKRILRSTTAELSDDAVSALIAAADVVLESGPVSTLRTLALRNSRPTLWSAVVHTVITPFGLSGPRREWLGDDTVITAAGGMAWLCGDAGQAPEAPPREQGTQLAGTHGAIGALLALITRRRTGTGQLVEISAQEAVAATLEIGAVSWIHGRTIPARTSGIYGHVAHRVFRARDGFLGGGYSGSPRMWDDFLTWMIDEGEAEDLADERWQDNDVRWRERAHVDAVVARFTGRRSARLFAEEARRRALPWAEVSSAEALSSNPQLLDRKFFVDTGANGSIRDVGFGWESPALPRPIRLAPPLDVSTDDAWATGFPRPAGAGPGHHRAEETSPGPAGALDGVRVLDLTWVLAGPYVTKIFAEHGADVLKVESFHRKDPTRFAPGMRLRPGADFDESGYFLNFNRNKRSIALNLKTEGGQALLRRLAADVDIVVENFSPGVLARWGLDFARLRELNPRVVLVSMAGVGQTGPWRDAVTFADTLAAMSGLTAETARPDRDPQGLTFGLGDMVAANAAVIGALELLHRGEGGHVDLSQLEAMASHLGTAAVESQMPTEPSDDLPARVLRCLGDDRWIAIGASAPDALRRVVSDLGFETDRDPMESLTQAAAQRDADSLAELLQGRGIAAYAVRDGRDLVETDAQLRERHFYVDLEHPLAGPVAHEGLVAHLSDTPGSLRTAAPLLGQHTDDILRERLGLTPRELAELHTEGVLT